MATPTLTRHELPGALGPIAVDVRAGGRQEARPAAVVVHGFKGFKDWGMFPPFAERLARAGISAVSLDVSGAGVDATGAFAHPDRFARNTFSAEVSDVTAVLDALARGDLGVAPPTHIGLVGHSRGGGVAVLVAASDARVRALVTWAAISTVRRWDDATVARWRREGKLDVVNVRTGDVLPLGTAVLDDIAANAAGPLDIPAAAARVTAPWLVVHGAADEAVPLAEGERLVAANPGAGWLPVAGAGHTFGARHPWAGSTPELEQVFRESVTWLGRHLT